MQVARKQTCIPAPLVFFAGVRGLDLRDARNQIRSDQDQTTVEILEDLHGGASLTAPPPPNPRASESAQGARRW